MNGYARLPDVRNEVNAQGSTAQDADIVRAIDRASDAARSFMHRRQFHTTVATKTFSPGCENYQQPQTDREWFFPRGASPRLLLNDDLISITTIKLDLDQDGVYEVTLTTADYYLWPENVESGYGYREIELRQSGAYSYWPMYRRSVQIVGKWGHSEFLDAVIVASAAVTGTLADATDLTLVCSAAVDGVIESGDTLYIEDEQIGPVIAVGGIVVTLQARGVNGTTAAAHSAKAVSIRRYPPGLERAVSVDAARYLWRASQGMPEGSFREAWPAISQELDSLSFAAMPL